jgi:hypothetical protein
MPTDTAGVPAQRVIQILREAGVVGDVSTAANKACALFCSGVVGLTSMVRQLEPDLHIDASVESLSTLQATPLVNTTKMVHIGRGERPAGLNACVEYAAAASAVLE